MHVTYGKRGRIHEIERGVRTIAPTNGRARLQTHCVKAGHIVVDGHAERLVSHLLEIDPSIAAFETQPFTVDLIEQRLLRSKEQLSEARRKHAKRSGPCLYTPDFCITWADRLKTALEVKAQGFEGDEEYASKLKMAKAILERHGYAFATMVAPQRINSPLPFNLQLLRQSRLHRSCLSEMDISKLDSLPLKPLTLGSACKALGCSMSHAPILVATGVLSMDIERYAMCADTPATLAHGDLGHLSIVRGLVQ